MLSFFIFFIQICINMAFCANILLKNRSCLGFNPYPPERGLLLGIPGGGWDAAPSRIIPDSRLKWAESVPFFRPKRRKTPTLWGGTYLYGLYKGVPPPPPPRDPYLPYGIALFPKTRNCSRPVCLFSPINGYRENTAGVTMRWTAFPFSNAPRYLILQKPG